MIKLSRDEMKKLMGGKALPPDEGGGGPCAAACAGTKASNYQGGTCSASTSPGVGGLPSTTSCTCSVSGGSGC